MEDQTVVGASGEREIEPVVAECKDCDGCGEVETADRRTLPCPTCVSRELNAAIALLKSAQLARATELPARPKLTETFGGDCHTPTSVREYCDQVESLLREKDAEIAEVKNERDDMWNRVMSESVGLSYDYEGKTFANCRAEQAEATLASERAAFAEAHEETTDLSDDYWLSDERIERLANPPERHSIWISSNQGYALAREILKIRAAALAAETEIAELKERLSNATCS